MQVREARPAGEADATKRLAGRHAIPGLDPDTALAEVAVLRLPDIAVRNHNPVAAFAAFDRAGIARTQHGIRHTVARAPHLPVGRRQHIDACPLRRNRRQPDVGPVMRVVGKRAARVVARTRTRVVIDIVLDDAGAADLARHRKAQLQRFGQGRGGEASRRGPTGAREKDDSWQGGPLR
jgi:hypothetical protein